MSLQDQVLEELKKTGNRLKKNLWHKEDLQTLAMIAEDLVGLNVKAGRTGTPSGDKKRYRQAAARLVDHAALLGLSRLNVANNDLLTALKEFFVMLVKQWLPKFLAALVA